MDNKSPNSAHAPGCPRYRIFVGQQHLGISNIEISSSRAFDNFINFDVLMIFKGNADAIPKEPFEKEKGRIPNMDISTRQHQNIHPASYIVEPTRKHTCTFILLHGLGSTGEKFGVELLDTARSSKGHKLIEIFPGARFIFPTAKKRRSSAFNRALITQWFDIASLDDPSHKMERQVEGLSDSAAYLFDILKKEIEIVAPENIILGGISHGCAMSLSLLLCLEHPLGGFIGMSGWLPYQKDLEEIMQVKDDIGDDIFGSDEEPVEQSPILKVVEFVRELLTVEAKNASLTNTSLSTPVFIGHGETDEKVKHILGQDISRTLKLLGMDVTWKLYPGHGHWYKTPEEIDDILSFLRTNVGLDINSNSRSS